MERCMVSEEVRCGICDSREGECRCMESLIWMRVFLVARRPETILSILGDMIAKEIEKDKLAHEKARREYAIRTGMREEKSEVSEDRIHELLMDYFFFLENSLPLEIMDPDEKEEVAVILEDANKWLYLLAGECPVCGSKIGEDRYCPKCKAELETAEFSKLDAEQGLYVSYKAHHSFVSLRLGLRTQGLLAGSNELRRAITKEASMTISF